MSFIVILCFRRSTVFDLGGLFYELVYLFYELPGIALFFTGKGYKMNSHPLLMVDFDGFFKESVHRKKGFRRGE